MYMYTSTLVTIQLCRTINLTISYSTGYIMASCHVVPCRWSLVIDGSKSRYRMHESRILADSAASFDEFLKENLGRKA